MCNYSLQNGNLPDYFDYQLECHEVFLNSVAMDYYHQGIEDALKALPALHPYNSDYMAGYNLQDEQSVNYCQLKQAACK